MFDLILSFCLFVDDLKNLDWQILLLLGGGMSLGTAVKYSGLLDLFVNYLQHISNNVYAMFLLFCFIVMVSFHREVFEKAAWATVVTVGQWRPW